MREKIAILSGSGLSAESGLPTFRDAAGLWRQHSWQDLASPEGWRANPALVLGVLQRKARQGVAGRSRDAAHLAIAALERKCDESSWSRRTLMRCDERAGSTHGAARPRRIVLRAWHRPSCASATGSDGAPIELGQLCEEAHAAAARHRVVWRRDAIHERGVRSTSLPPTRSW